MNLQQAVQILKNHNDWRRGSDIEMIEPSKIGIAIDKVVSHYEKEEFLENTQPFYLLDKKQKKKTKND